MKRIAMLIFFGLAGLLANGQGERNIWYFGDSAGISFNTISPTYLTDGFTYVNETCGSICDKNGNLLIFASGWDTFIAPYAYQLRVWNKNQQIMQNSAGIYGGYAITQGVLILPNPADSNSFYLLSISIFNSPIIRLYYSTIDMTLDSGKGAVVQKNILLCDSNISVKLTAIKHANGRDWWILAHEDSSNSFYEYLLSPSGISGPVIYSCGQVIGTTAWGTGGQLVFSQDGNKLCLANGEGQLDLFSFDRCSGVIAHTDTLSSTYINLGKGFYGCSFSSDGNFLYASTSSNLFQFNLNAANIKASKFTLFSVSNPNHEMIGQHLLGPDNKIYITHVQSPPLDSNIQFISVINNPDSLDSACSFSPYSFWLGGRKSRGGLPNLPNYNLGRLVGSPCDTLQWAGINNLSSESELSIYPNPANGQITITNLPQGNVTVTIYDIFGKQQLQKQIASKGERKMKWGVGDLSNGVYVYKVISNENNYNCSGKLIIAE